MSIQSEVERISTNVQNTLEAIRQTGVSVPENATCDALPAAAAALANEKQDKLTGTQGQVVGFDSSGNAIAQEAPSGLPEGGTQGQLLAKGASSAEWVDNPTRAFGPQTVATSAWAADTTYSAQGYGYRASVPLSGVTADHIPDVTFAMADAVSGNLAPLADTYAGGIYIYAKEQPSATVNIASVVCTKGAGT